MAIETGGPGIDVLNGSAGADTLTGAGGDDYYTVNDPGDLVVELPGEGEDHVTVSIDNYVLPDNVENLSSFVSSYHYNYFGNSLGNVIHVIRGVVYGFGGDDEIYGAGTFYGDAGADWLRLAGSSNGVASRFYGGDDNDVISSDFAINMIGADFRFYGDAGDDNITLGLNLDYSDNINIYGGADNDILNISGNIYSDVNLTIDGGSGADAVNLQNLLLFGSYNTISITGGSGDDVYTVDRAWTLTESAGGGHDIVNSSASFTLGAEFEDLVLTGASAIAGTGNGLANAVTGNSAANVITGGGGADVLSGGGGNDRFRATGAELVSGESIDGGANFDTLEITGGGAVSLSGITLSGLEALELTNAGGTTLTLAGSSQLALISSAAGTADIVNAGQWEGDLTEILRLVTAGVETLNFTDGPGASTTGWTVAATALSGGGFRVDWINAAGGGLWSDWTVNYDASGAPTTAAITFVDGAVRNDVYVAGLIATRSTFDLADVYDWSSVTTAHDAAGVLAARTTVWDDGRELVHSYSAGVLSGMDWTDPGDAADWFSITTAFAGGVISGSQVTMDDGRIATYAYSAGTLASVDWTDPLNAAGWSVMTITYNGAGGIGTWVTVLDDGRELTRVFSGAAAVSVTWTDPLGNWMWTRLEFIYDLAGVLDSYRLVRDDGREWVYGYAGPQTISGGAGNDYFAGGSGADTFIFVPGGGHDRVLDFADGEDLLDLTAFGIHTLAELQAVAAFTDLGIDLRLTFGTGETLTVAGFELAQLDDADFASAVIG